MVGHGHQIPLEVVGTMIEMADVAWNAIEHGTERKVLAKEDEIARIRSENQRLKTLLSENLSLLQGLSQMTADNCPPDLHTRLIAVVDTPNFLAILKSLTQELEFSPDGDLLFTKENDVLGVLNNADNNNPNRWVLVKHDIDPDSMEEASAIDNENYVVINEENVVDSIANFIARTIVENPKSKIISPEELKKAVTKALNSIRSKEKLKSIWEAGKIIYALSTWGIFIAELYRHPVIVKAAAKGAYSSTKFVLKAL